MASDHDAQRGEERTRAMSPDEVKAASDSAPTVISDSGAPAPPALPEITIEGVLGRGGMGVVYRGTQTWLDRAVAVKVLEVGAQSAGDRFVDRFRREAKLLARFDHPHIVKCYQAGVTDDERPYLVMELVEGCSLAQWVERAGPLGEDRALRVIADLADALEHAHAAGMIHRDVKPENVLLQTTPAPADGGPFTVKLADLGLARVESSAAAGDVGSGALTAAGVILGTPVTMAPEQFDDPESVDHRADIYGLGCVLYFALTGAQAFAGKTLSELLVAKSSAAPPDPQTLSACSAVAAEVVRDCLAARREQRPQHYRELIARCHAGADASTGGAKATPRRPSPIVLGTLGLLAAAAIVLAVGWPDEDPSAPSAPASPAPEAEEASPVAAAPAESSQPASSDDREPPTLAAAQAMWEPVFGAGALAGWTLQPPAAWGSSHEQEGAIDGIAGSPGAVVRAQRELPPPPWRLAGSLQLLDLPGADAAEAAVAVRTEHGELRLVVQRLPAGDHLSLVYAADDGRPRVLEHRQQPTAGGPTVSFTLTGTADRLWFGEATGPGVALDLATAHTLELRAKSGIARFLELRLATP